MTDRLEIMLDTYEDKVIAIDDQEQFAPLRDTFVISGEPEDIQDYFMFGVNGWELVETEETVELKVYKLNKLWDGVIEDDEEDETDE